MHLTTRNVNTAFKELVQFFDDGVHDRRETFYRGINPIVKRPSRNGNVLMIDEPVTITYTHPRERVLFNAARDANPFFHLYEALWMLAGRNDVAPLAFYAKQIKEYSDDGETLNGAYGFRWRSAVFPQVVESPDAQDRVDQLKLLTDHLRHNPTSRRAILQMWNVEDDLLKIDSSRDVCCNLSVMFSLRVEPGTTTLRPDLQETHIVSPHRVLDMTVTNRSNDMIWGLLGTNYVHFTMLQEYMAAHLGVEVGKYYHFTNNLHVYEWNWKPEEWIAWDSEAGSKERSEWPEYVAYGTNWIGRDGDSVNPEIECIKPSLSLVEDPQQFEKELHLFVDGYKGEVRGPKPELDELEEPFLRRVAAPMFRAHELFKLYREKETALRVCETIQADDWRIACQEWVRRRMK